MLPRCPRQAPPVRVSSLSSRHPDPARSKVHQLLRLGHGGPVGFDHLLAGGSDSTTSQLASLGTAQTAGFSATSDVSALSTTQLGALTTTSLSSSHRVAALTSTQVALGRLQPSAPRQYRRAGRQPRPRRSSTTAPCPDSTTRMSRRCRPRRLAPSAALRSAPSVPAPSALSRWRSWARSPPRRWADSSLPVS